MRCAEIDNCGYARAMAARDGDGWIECICGTPTNPTKHWGKHGAAGLLLVRDGAIFLQHRAPWVHNGDTWGIPGGARDSHESIIEAALREAVEETGLNPDDVTPLSTFTDDHTIWSYSTVIASASATLEGHELNDESHEVRWVKFDDVTRLPLHPSFARSWPLLRIEIDNLIAPL
jgi:8-oxo-dGTP diphosphatase